HFENMKEAMFSLSELVLKVQGDGDYEKAGTLIREKGVIREELQKDLDRIAAAGIPRDIVFEQGPEVLGL
ncbi:MAG TPA: Zn-dependent hydrolase, partial [Prolixibacteraceae bacterium]|nr:Zn-dependent hydrolase [Prolixibacteraceae bacterium]